jgi:hypothetical protein
VVYIGSLETVGIGEGRAKDNVHHMSREREYCRTAGRHKHGGETSEV